MTTAKKKKKELITFSPDLRADDACANYWMRQVTLRLRREVSWSWHERGAAAAAATEQAPGKLPPFSDKVSATLDLSRFWAEKQDFYMTDPTARYLTEQLHTKSPCAGMKHRAQGSFGWVVKALALDEVAQFVLALALTVSFDANMGSVIAACLNDQTKIYPTLALGQRLWDQPEDVLRIADPFHPLFRCGLIKFSNQSGHYYAETDWEAPLTVPSLVASQLLFAENPFPHGLAPLDTSGAQEEELTETARIVSLRLRADEREGLRIVPVMGAKGAARREVVRAIARENGKEAVEFKGDAALLDNSHYLNSIATLCWLRDAYLFFSKEPATPQPGAEKHRGEAYTLPSSTIPATLFLAINERTQLSALPSNNLLPAVQVPPSTYEQRVEFWKKNLGTKAKGLAPAIAECARRFRFEKETISAVCQELKELPREITAQDLVSACRAELDTDIGELASRVQPRFEGEKLVLPHQQQLQFDEILKAMQSLTEVHYLWGTGRVWNEGGISVLFAGPPGTGKTMAAEVLALALDLPMYRIDLSQVVNKYIGETEKNLKRVFDAADISDMILFFDEADSLFGRRTEVSDAHDRYANLEISYLLERMERFKGLAILATNRKKDLDEAFLRRLRYILDFPLPEATERKEIWQQVIPEHADASELNFDFLAEQFQLAGGNIRSVVFNACLQCAGESAESAPRKKGRAGTLTMEGVIVAVKREYDKMNRTMSLEQYGSYAPLVENLEHE
jgi:ATPase family associated with various cellular activities (AAA)